MTFHQFPVLIHYFLQKNMCLAKVFAFLLLYPICSLYAILPETGIPILHVILKSWQKCSHVWCSIQEIFKVVCHIRDNSNTAYNFHFPEQIWKKWKQIAAACQQLQWIKIKFNLPWDSFSQMDNRNVKVEYKSGFFCC